MPSQWWFGRILAPAGFRLAISREVSALRGIVTTACVLMIPALANGQQAGRPLVIFIHGRDYAFETAEIERQWYAAFEDGMAKLSTNQSQRLRTLIRPADRVMVRYDAVYEPDYRPSAACGGQPTNRASVLAHRRVIWTDALEQLWDTLSPPPNATASQKEQYSVARARVQTTAAAMQSIVFQLETAESVEDRALSGILTQFLLMFRAGAVRAVGPRVAVWLLRDTQTYLEKGSANCDTRAALRKELTSASRAGRPVVLVAHSMGALVAMEELWRSETAGYRLLRFVTLGSQLGGPGIMQYLVGGPSSKPLLPQSLMDWINIVGENDVLAFKIDPDVRFADRSNSRFREIRIDTGKLLDTWGLSSKPHSVVRYLQMRNTAAAIADAWCKGFGESDRPAACQQLPGIE